MLVSVRAGVGIWLALTRRSLHPAQPVRDLRWKRMVCAIAGTQFDCLLRVVCCGVDIQMHAQEGGKRWGSYELQVFTKL